MIYQNLDSYCGMLAKIILLFLLKLIETLRPDIVISVLVRNHRYTGLDIIKQYNIKKDGPKFLVISADKQEDFTNDEVKFDGFIQKPCAFDEIIVQLRKISKKN